METLQCIKTRRSIRQFLDKPISDKLIAEILTSATHAPSSQNSQPWHFIIVKDKLTKSKLAELKDPNNQGHILTASVIMVVGVDTIKSPSRWIEDGVTVALSILLTAHDLGLGAVYVTGFKLTEPEIAEKIRAILKLPNNITPINLIPLGYKDPTEELMVKELVDLKEIVHYEQW